jgi:hypothetical protein
MINHNPAIALFSLLFLPAKPLHAKRASIMKMKKSKMQNNLTTDHRQQNI